MTEPRFLLELELRPVESHPDATPGASVFVLLPTLQDLLGAPDFGRRDPISLRPIRGPVDGWTLFGRETPFAIH